MKTKKFSYSRDKVSEGILHFGVGNFHRAHLAYFTNELLSKPGNEHWGICGAMLMPSDQALFESLQSQDNIYSLTICSRDGSSESQWIGSLTQLLWAGDNQAQIIAKIADKNIKIITMTITEGGYTLDSEAVRHDLLHPKLPKSIFGYIAEGLRARRASRAGAITILTCDNLQHNGDTCRRIFTEFFSLQDPELNEWVRDNVSFPNSMVDRITPATTPADVERLNQEIDMPDKAPVYCEDFIQWVIEDKFIAGRPDWEQVGVEFTHDVVPYENMKLSLLNASHTLLSYPSVLMGYRKVDVAMRDERMVSFVSDFMNKDADKYVPAPENTDLRLYKKTLIERFANQRVSDQLSRLCGDGASKFPVYVMPLAQKMLSQGDDMTRIAFLLASYYIYLREKTDDKGESFEIYEPKLLATDYALVRDENCVKFLSASPFAMADFAKDENFVSLYSSMVENIKAQGAEQTLETII